LQTPALKSLKLVKYWLQDVTPSAITTFCHRSSATLASLVLHGLNETWLFNDFHKLVRFPFPQLRDLQLSDWKYRTLYAILPVLTPENDQEWAENLPGLRSLTLYNYSMSFTTGLDHYNFYCSLLYMLQQQGAGVNHVFNLNLENLSFGTFDLEDPRDQDRILSFIQSRQIVLLQNLALFEPFSY
jgi:hypothetical protein